MSAAASSPKTGATFLWVLGAFTGFAILLAIVLNLSKPADVDPRIPERLANKEEINKAQADLLAKMGLTDPAKKDALFASTAETFLKNRKVAPSTQVVPGSPTQLKQAAAAAPAPAATPAPAAPAAPAPAPAKP